MAKVPNIGSGGRSSRFSQVQRVPFVWDPQNMYLNEQPVLQHTECRPSIEKQLKETSFFLLS